MPGLVRPSGISKLSLVVMAAACAGACAGGQKLNVEKIDATTRPPANVALYLKIKGQGGQRVELEASDFKVYEDGKAVPSKKLKRALLPVKYVLQRYALILVDLSGPLVDSEYLSTLHDSVAGLAAQIGKNMKVAISGFDGDGIVPFVTFEDEEPTAGLAGMRKFRPRGRNVDLWGAFVNGLDSLDKTAAHASVPYHQLSMVVVTDRWDRAGKHSQEEVVAKVKKAPADVYVIGIGDSVNREDLELVGKSGAFFAEKPKDIPKPFVDVATKIDGTLGQDYLFAYCSPQKAGARAGKHVVEVKIGKARVEHEFSTKGFTGATCDPKKKPEFGAAAEKVQSSAADGADGEGDEDAGESKKARGGKKRAKRADEESEE